MKYVFILNNMPECDFSNKPFSKLLGPHIWRKMHFTFGEGEKKNIWLEILNF